MDRICFLPTNTGKLFQSQNKGMMFSSYRTVLELEGRSKIASSALFFCARQNVPEARAFAPYRSMTDRNRRQCGCLLYLGCTMSEKRTGERTIYRSNSFCLPKKFRRKFLAGATFYGDWDSSPTWFQVWYADCRCCFVVFVTTLNIVEDSGYCTVALWA